MNWRISIAAVLLWTLIFGAAAEAASMNYLLNCYSNNNMSASTFNTWNSTVLLNGRWQPLPTNTWYVGDQSHKILEDGTYYVNFLRIQNFYVPDVEVRVVAANDLGYTNYYHVYSNTLNVVISGLSGTSAAWSVSSYPSEFTNSSIYRVTYTNTQNLSPIPEGEYVITFGSVYGYTTPGAVTSTVGATLSNSVTGAYSPLRGNLQITPQDGNGAVLSSAPWILTGYPTGYTNNIYTGTGQMTISNVMIGAYTVTFQPLSGYESPGAVSGTVYADATTIILGTYSLVGYTLVVHIGAPLNRQQDLPGIGNGSCLVQYDTSSATQSVMEATYVVNANATVTLTAMTNYVYRWYYNTTASTNPPTYSVSPLTNTYQFIMNTERRTVWLLYSRAYNEYDHVGDIDQDGLPDGWEMEYFRPSSWIAESVYPMSEISTNQYDNPDNDFIPSSSTNLLLSVSIDTNNIITYNGVGGNPPGYPLQRSRLLSPQQAFVSADARGYSTGAKFNNYLEARGLDGIYLTNGPTGSVPNDDPMTDPTRSDTDNDGFTDGWEYYFWYWRSADSYANGLTNSANLSWATLKPTTWDNAESLDMDGDEMLDIDEHDDIWTDPTHCDTDGDGMDDYWETHNITPDAIANSNVLDYVNNYANLDGDFMAWVTNGVLTNGTIGTSLSTNVYYVGTALNPGAAWIETGSNAAFNVYTDVVLKASSALTNRAAGTHYTHTAYYGTNASFTAYKNGYPVWVDMDDNGSYTLGTDVPLVNPNIKHDGVYIMPPAVPYPGVCSFNPYTAWTNIAVLTNGTPYAAPSTLPYTTYQEYLGADFIGRLTWDAAGKMVSINDVNLTLNRNSYSNPNIEDSDVDQIPDGWELYVGLDPNNPSDAGVDSDGDHLSNHDEWANATHSLGTCLTTWPLKTTPTDPGVITAPAPNDPHPKDTDWDGLLDGFTADSIADPKLGEQTEKSNPTAWDTDGDHLPDGWEVYAGSSVTNADAKVDLDGDGLPNYQEYWSGTVPEWMFCDRHWQTIDLCCRRAMTWDPFILPKWSREEAVFIPPDYLSDPCFMYTNGVYTSLAMLRTTYPARNSWDYARYHTLLAKSPDSDEDNLDDYWEIYHGLNPCMGMASLILADNDVPMDSVASVDADPATPGYQFGLGGNPPVPFHSLNDYITYIEPYRNDKDNRIIALSQIIGPFNFGRYGMDPDGDGLANLEEYSYSSNRPFYHTDPSPRWRTDQNDTNSFINLNYRLFNRDRARYYWWQDWDTGVLYPFKFETTEGYDTDNDGAGDYAEINSAAGELGTNPLDERNPIRNRALYFNGTNDFARQFSGFARYISESMLTKFCVEAWIKPDNPQRSVNQVFLEKAGLYRDPYVSQTPPVYIVGANFRMGLTNGLPYVLYNGRTSYRAYQATAQTKHRITSSTNWTHVAGSYDGTNLTIYVNGEESYSLHTTELPVNGFNIVATNEGGYYGTHHTIIAGASDRNPGGIMPSLSLEGVTLMGSYAPSPTNCFGGCVDEARIWDGSRTRAEILANRYRRLTQTDITNNMAAIFSYFTFDDVPDPDHSGESIFPSGLDDLNSDMHPAINWWKTNTMRSTVYIGVTNSYNYMVFAKNHGWHSRALIPSGGSADNQLYAGDDYYHYSTNFLQATNATPSGYINPANPYYDIDHYIDYNYDLLLYCGARSVTTNSWLASLDPNNPDSTDTDGDGMPDWWEQQYGLDPNSSSGDNGAWGDPDNDGLNNLAEYLAGTDPRNSDTYGTGVGDYYYHPGPYTRTLGELYTDHDRVPDLWKIQYGLDTYHYVANQDEDNDGWSNYSEYQAGTDPSDSSSYPQPHVFGTADYFGNKSGTLNFFAYSTNTMDGKPEATTLETGQRVTETIGSADGTLFFAGTLPVFPITQATVVNISAPVGPSNTVVTFTFTGPGTNTYSGSGKDSAATLNYTTGRLTIRWASAEVPAASANVSVDYTYINPNSAVFNLSGFTEGDFYIVAMFDANTLGLLENQPITLGQDTLTGMRILVKDSAPGYGRFSWTASTTGTSDYQVVINKISESGAPTILTRTVRWPRNDFHEWDYQLAGYYGLPNGHYQWWMNGQQGTFNITWPASVSTPSLVYPRGEQLNLARNQFQWIMDVNSTMYHLQVARQASDGGMTFVIDQYYPAPFRDINGISQAYLPKYAGELGNGIYYWRVSSWSPAGESAWAAAQTFEINLNATNSYSIAGDIYYFGKADSSNIIVEAFNNSGFGGKPDARILLNPTSRTNENKGSFVLRGLQAGTYYVRAYLDVTPAGGTRDDKFDWPWKSFGFIRNDNNFYQPQPIALLNTTFVEDTKIVIRDSDTDNDKLPDAWEMYYLGTLDYTGDMVSPDGMTYLQKYETDGYDLSPVAWDSDGDGLSDNFEMHYSSATYGFAARKAGEHLNPNAWDSDRDGYSDGAEVKRYHTDPLDSNGYPGYRPLCFDAWASPSDYDGDGRSDFGIYDVASGTWRIMNAPGQSFELPFGNTATQPLLGDYDGDGCCDFALYEPVSGAWYLYNAWTGQSFRLNFGDSEMIPVPADYDGDGRTDLAVYYPADGTWYIYSVWSGQLYTLKFGGPSMTPVPGDYNNDGACDLGVYEAASGSWNLYLFDHYTHAGQYLSAQFGGPTMIPAPGDYDGDGRNDAALYEPTTGNWYILTWKGQFFSGQFGGYGCIPVPGDYDGDGRTDVAVYYPPGGMWYIYCMSGRHYQAQLGSPAAAPVLKGRM